MEITPELVKNVKNWLGKKGIQFFLDLKSKYGIVNPIWMENNIPHCVHFREGMQVRNKLRELTNNKYTCHEYDDNWKFVIEKAIEDEICID